MPPGDTARTNESSIPRDEKVNADFVEELLSVGLAAGLDRVGVCDAAVLDRARSELHRRKTLGLSDTMQFTYRNPERATDPTRSLTRARSIFVGARSYHSTPTQLPEPRGDDPGPRARVAKYAWHDHYTALRIGLEAVAAHLRRAGEEAIVVADENNLVDREVAWKAGIGWFGKNANLLVPGAGSWFVLGSVITSAELGPGSGTVPDGCGTCRRCIDSCPTGAIVADGVVDARSCLAWLVQKPGVFPSKHRVALGDRLYGCDDCQDSCPITVRLGTRHVVVNSAPGSIGSDVDVLDVLEAEDASLMTRFGRWYIPERDPRWVRRNALIILGNVASIPLSRRATKVLDRYLRSDDPHLRGHALWAAHRLGADALVAALEPDADPIVVAERDNLATVPRRTSQPHGQISAG